MFINDGSSIPVAPSKDPYDVLDWGAIWTDWLNPGESIVNSEWILPDDLEEEAAGFNTNTTAVYISGGVIGNRYKVTNRITTDAAVPRIVNRSMYINCYPR